MSLTTTEARYGHTWQLGDSVEVQRCGAWYPAEIVGFEQRGTILVCWGADVPRTVGWRRQFVFFGEKEPVTEYSPKMGEVTREHLHPDHVRMS